MNPSSSLDPISAPKKTSVAFLVIAFLILLGVSLVFLFMKDSLFPARNAQPPVVVDQQKLMEEAYGAKASSTLDAKEQVKLEKGYGAPSKNDLTASSGLRASLENGYGSK